MASQPRGVQLARPIRGEVILFTVKQIVRLLRASCAWSPYSITISPPRSYYLMGVVVNLGIPIAKPLIVAPGLKRF